MPADRDEDGGTPRPADGPAGGEPVVAVFSEADVRGLTGIPGRRLRRWERAGLFGSSLAGEDRERPSARVHSFMDVARLRVLDALRDGARVPLPHLRDVNVELSRLGEALWAGTTLHVLDGRVVLLGEGAARGQGIAPGRGALRIPLAAVLSDTRRAVRALRERDAATVGRVERRRDVLGGRPVIAGTRIPVAAVRAFAAAGFSDARIMGQYPSLTEADVEGARRASSDPRAASRPRRGPAA